MGDELPQDVAPADDLSYDAWCVIANVGHNRGGWQAQDPEWEAAAERWRDRWHAKLDRREWADDLASADAAQFDADGRLRWAPPTRLDPGDSTTWPEEGQRVLVWILDGWAVQEFGVDESGLLWSDTDDTGEWAAEPTTGDLWLPLPPTQGGAE